MREFFDNFFEGIRECVKKIRTASRNMIEKVRITTKIKDNDKEKSRILQDIGTIVYNLHINGEMELESCNTMFDEVRNIDKQIISLQKRVEEIEDDNVIVSASQNELSIPENSIVCECGNVNKEGAKFCVFCGKEL